MRGGSWRKIRRATSVASTAEGGAQLLGLGREAFRAASRRAARSAAAVSAMVFASAGVGSADKTTPVFP